MDIIIKLIKATKTYYAYFITIKYSNCWFSILSEHNYSSNTLISIIVKFTYKKKSHFKRNILNALHSLKISFPFLDNETGRVFIFLCFKLKITSPKMEI